jgi:hypothetical protein
MNVFATDHRMAAQPSCFDATEYPWRSFFWSILVLALILLPLFAGLALYLIPGDDAFTPEELPSVIDFITTVFLFCLFLAFGSVSAHRLLAWPFQKKR